MKGLLVFIAISFIVLASISISNGNVALLIFGIIVIIVITLLLSYFEPKDE